MKKEPEIGASVVAIHSYDGRKLQLYGYGVYLGEKRPSEVPQKPGGCVGAAVEELDNLNPCIHLDNGSYIWGCECHWARESVGLRYEKRAESVSYRDIELDRAAFDSSDSAAVMKEIVLQLDRIAKEKGSESHE